MKIISIKYFILFSFFIQVFSLHAQVSDIDVKVAYIYRFTDYIDWFKKSNLKTFSIGVFEDDEMILEKFNYLAQSRKIKNLKIKIIPIESIDQLKHYNLEILYLGSKRNAEIIDVFTLINGKNTLIISDNCQIKEAVMINFLPSARKDAVLFELNKKNAINEDLIIQPEILLLGGTYLDVRTLFKEKELELEREKEKLKKSKEEVHRQNQIILSQDELISEKESIIESINGKIHKQEYELIKQKYEFDRLLEEIDLKKNLLGKKIEILKEQDSQIKNQDADIISKKSELEKQKGKINKQSQLIKNQEYVLNNQLSELRFQRNMLYVFIAILLLVLSLVYFIYKNFRNKKLANIKLKNYNDEILAQNEEIKSQRAEIKDAHDKLQLANNELEKLSIVASYTNNAVLIANANGDIEWVNKGFTSIFGYELEDLIHTFGKNLVTTSSYAEIKEKVEICKREKKTLEYLALNTTKWGEELWMHTSLTPIIDDHGEIRKLIIIEANVTELKKAEQSIKNQKIEIEQQRDEIEAQRDKLEFQNSELEKHQNDLETIVDQRTKQLLIAKEQAEESDRLKSAFIANLSHEIRTPMNAIVGFSALLTEPDITGEKASEYINIINNSAFSLARLIDDIIDLSRIEVGELVIKKTNFNVNHLLEDLFTLYTEQINRERLTIKFSYSKLKGSHSIINTDKVRLNQVLINLLDNALKFTDNGFVEYGCKPLNESHLLFYVKDTGIGIEENKQSFIFEPFTKVETNSKKLYRGTGLGLSICKTLVNYLGGNIWVKSKLGKGAEFYFTVRI